MAFSLRKPNIKVPSTGAISENYVELRSTPDENWVVIKSTVRNDLVEVLNPGDMSSVGREQASKDIFPAVVEILKDHNIDLINSKLDQLCRELIDEIIGFGPLESLLARDEISDIMVNGHRNVFVEINGLVERAPISFSSDEQLLQICQRIVRQVGRRIDESSPMCDARLLDGSRVNVIIPPLAIDGPVLTIRKFKKDRLTLSDFVKFGSVTRAGADLLGIIGRVRCNILISGGTGSGKTTLLNTMTAFIEEGERIVTCEDTAELQLQRSHVVRLETRPENIEGEGEITMHDLVRNCLRMRPDRIIVGEVRGGEAFDLLQAMNTGHDGSMGTLHSNSPREALFRLESMIAASPSGTSLPLRAVREMISGSVDIVIQAERLRDGRRVISSVTEVIGLEGETIVTQELFRFQVDGVTESGSVSGRHEGTGITSPNFMKRADQFGEQKRVLDVLAQINAEG